jgi:hypothetical protein
MCAYPNLDINLLILFKKNYKVHGVGPVGVLSQNPSQKKKNLANLYLQI